MGNTIPPKAATPVGAAPTVKKTKKPAFHGSNPKPAVAQPLKNVANIPPKPKTETASHSLPSVVKKEVPKTVSKSEKPWPWTEHYPKRPEMSPEKLSVPSNGPYSHQLFNQARLDRLSVNSSPSPEEIGRIAREASNSEVGPLGLKLFPESVVNPPLRYD